MARHCQYAHYQFPQSPPSSSDRLERIRGTTVLNILITCYWCSSSDGEGGAVINYRGHQPLQWHHQPTSAVAVGRRDGVATLDKSSEHQSQQQTNELLEQRVIRHIHNTRRHTHRYARLCIQYFTICTCTPSMHMHTQYFRKLKCACVAA